jgi:hypothetical protein
MFTSDKWFLVDGTCLIHTLNVLLRLIRVLMNEEAANRPVG